jgi:hypothetical protein
MNLARSPRIAPLDFLRLLGRRYLLTTAAATALVAVLIGLPTDLLPNPWFTRVVDSTPFDYVVWGLTSLLTGALLATYALPAAAPDPSGRRAGLGAGILGWLAVGCPVCNKLVVTLLGTSGALTYFAPLQPFLGVLAIALSATALGVRLNSFLTGCKLKPEASR